MPPHGNGTATVDARRMLVERIAESRYLGRSARLHDLLLYISERVLEDEASEIHEQEVGHKVFGRPADYDTASDNIVRVHASMLRKRLEQYFAAEGASEPLILEIPKGNYAPVFRERVDRASIPDAAPLQRMTDWRILALAGLAVLFACSTAFLLLRQGWTPAGGPRTETVPSTVRQLWSQVFQPERPTDIVLDDATLGLLQELTGRPVALSDYFDRSYLRSLAEASPAAGADPKILETLVLRRHASAASVGFLWKLWQMPGAASRHGILRFARDYSFRDLRSHSALLLGNVRSNPWMEPFLARLGLRWEYDRTAGIYYPVDTRPGGKNYHSGGTGDTPHEGYCSISLLPNLGGGGNVLIVSSTGGSALNAGADFLADESAMSRLRRLLPSTQDNSFPAFESLIKVMGHRSRPQDATIVLCRPAGRD